MIGFVCATVCVAQTNYMQKQKYSKKAARLIKQKYCLTDMLNYKYR